MSEQASFGWNDMIRLVVGINLHVLHLLQNTERLSLDNYYNETLVNVGTSQQYVLIDKIM